MAPRHRSDDGEDTDRWKLRKADLWGRYVSWVAGALGVLFLGALVAFAGRDRENVDRRLDSLDAHVNAVEALTTAVKSAQAASEARSEARWEDVQRTLGEIKTDVKAVKLAAEQRRREGGE